MNKRVLIVDDEPKLRNILARVLAEKNYEVEVAVNGRQALEKLSAFEPHLIIADIAMPEMDGFELCRRIRQDNQYGALRFIFLTAKDDASDEVEGLMLGADDYVTKPFDVEKLLARIDARLRWLDKAEALKASDDVSCNIEGGLGGRNLMDVLQIIELSQKTGELVIESQDKRAHILIDEGKIVDARFKEKQGKIVVFTVLTWSHGRFRFVPHERLEGTESLQITHVLLEWARISDELARNKKPGHNSNEENIINEFIDYIKKRELKER